MHMQRECTATYTCASQTPTPAFVNMKHMPLSARDHLCTLKAFGDQLHASMCVVKHDEMVTPIAYTYSAGNSYKQSCFGMPLSSELGYEACAALCSRLAYVIVVIA